MLKTMTEEQLIFGRRITLKVRCIILATIQVASMRVSGDGDGDGDGAGAGEGEEEVEGEGAKVITKDAGEDVDVKVIVTAIVMADGPVLEAITLVVVAVGLILILQVGEAIKTIVGVRMVLVKAMTVEPLILVIRIAMNVIRTAIVAVDGAVLEMITLAAAAAGELIKARVGVTVVLEKAMAVELLISAIRIAMRVG